MTAHELLHDLQRQGFILRPLPSGKLEVRPASKLTEELRAQLRQRKAEVLALLIQQPSPWPCPHCGGTVCMEAPDEHVPTRFWSCRSCGAWGATREGARYPGVWVSGGGMQ